MVTENRSQLVSPSDAGPLTASMPLIDAQAWDSPCAVKENQPVVSIFITQSAYCQIRVHTSIDMQHEVGGVLVGQWLLDDQLDQQFIVIENSLPARHTRQGRMFLTFTQDSLVFFHKTIEEHYSGKRIVGWYHTHPGMGIFLSHYDTWLHSNFFPEPWQVALVVDPRDALAGFFIRQRDGSLDAANYFGFYELNGYLGRSLVRWKNLHRAEVERE